MCIRKDSYHSRKESNIQQSLRFALMGTAKGIGEKIKRNMTHVAESTTGNEECMKLNEYRERAEKF